MAESSKEKGRLTKETLSPSKKLPGMCEGWSGFAGNLASAAQLMPCRVTSRFWGSRNMRPSMRSRMEDIAGAEAQEQ